MDLQQEIPAALPILMLDEWRVKFTGFLIKFGILSVFFIGCFIAIFATGSVKDVIENWSRYRCNPLILPFSDFFGYDAGENFQFCVKSMMQNQSGEFFQPVYGLLGQFSSSLGMIVNTTNGFRKVLGNFRLSTDSFVGSVQAKISALLLQIRLSFMRMQTLMGRVYGTMYSIIWMGTSAITAGTSLQENSLVNFMFEFCFAPNTLLQLADGSQRFIKDVQIGDILEGNAKVTSTFIFDGTRTPMVSIGADVLSGEHRVKYASKWIAAHQHPSALPTPSIPLLICLNVEGHVFRTAAGLEVADYDESENPVAIAAAQTIAQKRLNGSVNHVGSSKTVRDYALGLDPDAEVCMHDASWKFLHSLHIDDRVLGGATVVGCVKEVCQTVFEWGDVAVSAAQLIYVDEQWTRAEHLRGSRPYRTPPYLLHVLTDVSAPLFLRKSSKHAPIVVRDYREAALPEMETPYLDTFLEEK